MKESTWNSQLSFPVPNNVLEYFVVEAIAVAVDVALFLMSLIVTTFS